MKLKKNMGGNNIKKKIEEAYNILEKIEAEKRTIKDYLSTINKLEKRTRDELNKLISEYEQSDLTKEDKEFLKEIKRKYGYETRAVEVA